MANLSKEKFVIDVEIENLQRRVSELENRDGNQTWITLGQYWREVALDALALLKTLSNE